MTGKIKTKVQLIVIMHDGAKDKEGHVHKTLLENRTVYTNSKGKKYVISMGNKYFLDPTKSDPTWYLNVWKLNWSPQPS